MRRIIAIVLALLALLSLILIVRAADAGKLPDFITQLYNFKNGDKVGHFLLMGSVAFLVTLAMPRAWRLRGLIVLAGLITLEEFSQLIFTTRTFDLLDLACSLAGVTVFGTLSVLFNRALDKKLEGKKNGNKK
ncbi:MAG: hypothetical protein VB013_06335 [Anaerolineaceae bacterium]|nr:hypothetical protein [Anaerolineaceae bacterium]